MYLKQRRNGYTLSEKKKQGKIFLHVVLSSLWPRNGSVRAPPRWACFYQYGIPRQGKSVPLKKEHDPKSHSSPGDTGLDDLMWFPLWCRDVHDGLKRVIENISEEGRQILPQVFKLLSGHSAVFVKGLWACARLQALPQTRPCSFIDSAITCWTSVCEAIV